MWHLSRGAFMIQSLHFYIPPQLLLRLTYGSGKTFMLKSNKHLRSSLEVFTVQHTSILLARPGKMFEKKL